MLYNEERPWRFDDIVGQEYNVSNIRNQSKRDEFFQVYILAGQFGSGKTTIGRIIPLAANCDHKDENGNPCGECPSCQSILNNGTMDVIEIDGASNTGVDDIRKLKESASFLPSELKYKVYIIDEVHMLSKNAFNSLLKLLEEPPKHVIFILCTTDLVAIPATVRSRGATYIFGQIPVDQMSARLLEVSHRRGFHVNEEAIAIISKNSSGSMRNAYSLLEQSIRMSDEVTADVVNNMIGISDPTHLFKLLTLILKCDMVGCISQVEYLVSQGKDLFLLLNDMLDILADGIVASCSGIELIKDTQYYLENLSELLKLGSNKHFCSLAQELVDVRDGLRKTPSKTTLIVGLIRVTREMSNTTTALLDRVEMLENELKKIKETGIHVVNSVSVPIENASSDSSLEVLEISTNDTFDSEENNKEFEALTDLGFATTQNGVPWDEQDNETSSNEDKISETESIYEDANESSDIVDDNASEEEANTTSVVGSVEEVGIKTEQKTGFFDDIFAMISIFGSLKQTEEKHDEEKEVNKEVKEQKVSEPVKNEVKTTSNSVPNESFDVMNMLFPSKASVESTSVKEEKAKVTEPIELSKRDQTELDRIQAYLDDLYEDDKILDNAIELGCRKTVVDGTVVLSTELEPVFRLVQAYIENRDLPLEIELV